MATLTKRTQLLLQDQQYEWLKARAEERGTSVGSVVRELIESSRAGRDERITAACAALLDLKPIAVDDWDVIENELDTDTMSRFEEEQTGQ